MKFNKNAANSEVNKLIKLSIFAKCVDILKIYNLGYGNYGV